MTNAARARAIGDSLSKALRSTDLSLLVAIGVILAAIYTLDRQGGFFTPYSLRTLVHNAAMFGVLSLGAAIVIIAGGIDLSVGSVVALSSIISSSLVMEWLPRWTGALKGTKPYDYIPPAWVVPPAIALTLLTGVAIGVVH